MNDLSDISAFTRALYAAMSTEALGERQTLVTRGCLPSDKTLFVLYVNLPPGYGGAGGGAEAENNRMTFCVTYKGDGKVKVEHLVGLGRNVCLPLRGKTTTPGKAAAYIADYLTMVYDTVPPKYTHSTPPA